MHQVKQESEDRQHESEENDNQEVIEGDNHYMMGDYVHVDSDDNLIILSFQFFLHVLRGERMTCVEIPPGRVDGVAGTADEPS